MGKIGGAAVRGLLRMAVLLLAVCAASFFLVSLSPLDPLKTNVGQTALGSMSREQVERLEAYWQVGVPAWQRFMAWFWGLCRGDLGVSLLYRRPVLEVIGEKAANSACVMVSAWFLSGFLGLLLGIIAGAKRGRWQDRLITGYAMVTAAAPAFWVALLLLFLFAVRFPIFPIGFGVPVGVAASEVTLSQRISHAFLPALTLGLTGVSGIAMHTRSKMIEILESDYICYARARGERGITLLLRHGLRNLLLPFITLQLGSISEIFGGSVLVEQVFSYPGLGQAAVTAGLGSDVPLLLGITLISAALVFLGNFTADLLYLLVDPRMRRSRERETGGSLEARGAGSRRKRGIRDAEEGGHPEEQDAEEDRHSGKWDADEGSGEKQGK